MKSEAIVDAIDRQQWLNPIMDAVQGAVRGAYAAGGPAGRQVKNFLHGTWLGHPLHAVLTDVPVGAWTAAAVLDVMETTMGEPKLGAGADAAVALGVGGATAAALAGLTDWEPLTNRRGRLGTLHAALNTAALVLYGTSLACRRAGQRGTGRALAFAGYAIMSASAYLGGELVYALQTGVDHASEQRGPEAFTPVLAEADLSSGQPRRVDAAGTPVLLVREAGRIYALADTCSHLGCSLAEGQVEEGTITCACHGSRFALSDGAVLDGPSTYSQPAYDVRIRDGQIEVRRAVDLATIMK